MSDQNESHPQPDQQQQQQPSSEEAQTTSSLGKLFVGQVPAVCTEDMLRPVFQPYGEIVEIKIMRDAPGGRSKGCAWVKYATREQAQSAIEALHEQHTIPPQTNTLQVRFADDKARTGGSATAFVGNLPSNTSPEDLRAFIDANLPDGLKLKEVNVPAGKLFGFLTFETPQDCSSAVAHVQGKAPVLNGNALRIQSARPRASPGANNMAAAMAAYYASFARGGGPGMPMMDPSAAFFMSRGGGGGYGGGGYGGPQGGAPPNPYAAAAAAATASVGNGGGYGSAPPYPGHGGGGGRGRGRGGHRNQHQHHQHHQQYNTAGGESWNRQGGPSQGQPPQ